MPLLVHQVLLLVSVAALGAAGWRVASVAVPSGLLRAIATAVLAAGAAVLCALALALVALGASAVALTVLAVGLWAVSMRALPAAGPPSAYAQLREWWGGLSIAGRAGRGAVAAVLIAYGAWVLRHPGIGLDALTYHLALPVDWVHNGRPGSLVAVNDGLPIQNYPLTWEVLVAWAAALGGTLVPATLLTPGTLVLLGAAVRAGLGELGVPARLAWLAAGALGTLPLVVIQLPGPNNDLPELAWLACVAALAAGAAPWRPDRPERHPALLAIALIALGLCVGTKTTGAPLAVLALLIAGWACRRELRRLAGPLVLAAVAAALIGGVWYLRNLLDHGSPFWPLSTTPWGDPIPAAFRAVDASLLSKLSATLHGRTDAYWHVLEGGVILFLGALASTLWARTWAARAAALVAVAALLEWAASPYTGYAKSTDLAIGATRYLLPCALAAAVAVALAGRAPPNAGGTRRVAVAEALSALVLLGAVVLNINRDSELGFPNAPSLGYLAVAAVIGAVAVLLAEGLARASGAGGWLARAGGARAWLARRGAPLLAAATTAAALATLLLPVGGYMSAHAGTGLFDSGLVKWLDSRAAFRDGHQPLLIGPVTVAVLTGARFAHPLDLLPADDRCATLARQARHAWVVMEIGPTALGYDRHWILCLPRRRPAYLDANFLVYAPPALTRAAPSG
ncbi:MAG TPA: hypothetical protein VG186_11645 [Solirubrobacteraceae bacterium]|nr:hypothetical protein [Solirubrobacteraceae bacterium]